MAPHIGFRNSLSSSPGSTQGTSLLPDSPLIVVSNRLPFVLKRESDSTLKRQHSAGGLVTALAPVVIQCGGHWVGWPGLYDLKPNEVIPESDPSDNTPTAGLLSSQVVPVNISKSDFNEFYNGCCNGTFWPLFHSMPDRAVFSSETWKAYQLVNECFARRTLDALRATLRSMDKQALRVNCPIIWIHDYQLLLAATTIRQVAEEENLPCKLGFFLHIPFPSWDIMRLFPWDDHVLQGMLGCDLVGFHIEDYCLNFMDCCQRRLGCRVDRNNMILEFAGRNITVKALPIGIPFQRFVQLAKTAPTIVMKNETIILGVDRLDYTKGLVHRIKAFERLLEMHPEHLEKVTLLQIAVPSRTDVKEYQQLKEEMDQLIGRVNGRFSKPHWSPIRYMFGCVSQGELAAMYRDSAVALVTPLRDGMNLVAKEYVACQTKSAGVLILSPFAGAGGMMKEALLANPYETNGMAEVLHRALSMPEDERLMRMTKLRRREAEMDVDQWLASFLDAMDAISIASGQDRDMDDVVALPRHLQPMALEDFDAYLADYIDESCKLSILLDYDGALTPIATHPDKAILPPETREILRRLSEMPDVNVCIMSGRSLSNLREMVKLEGITYAGSQGLEIEHPDGTRFVQPIPVEYDDKLRNLLQALQDEVCCSGAWVENKGALLTYHYRETPAAVRDTLVQRAVAIFEAAGLQPHHISMAVEARPTVSWDKGRAAIYILRSVYGVDWPERVRIVYAGDDVSDGAAMEVLRGIACTFRVSSAAIARTAANFRLANPRAVQTMLRWLEEHMAVRHQSMSLSSSPRLASILDSSPCVHSEMSFEEADFAATSRRRRHSSRSSWSPILKTVRLAYCSEDKSPTSIGVH